MISNIYDVDLFYQDVNSDEVCENNMPFTNRFYLEGTYLEGFTSYIKKAML